MSRKLPVPKHRDKSKFQTSNFKLPSLSVIIPVYNEEKTVLPLLGKLISADIRAQLEIIIIDDGSTDGTGELLEQNTSYERLMKLITLRHETNLGKGAAIRSGLKLATGDFTVIQDADLEYEPGDIQKIINAYQDLVTPRRRLAIYGSRLLDNPFPKRGYVRTLVGNHAITLITNVLYSTQLSDSYTCYKFAPTRLWRKLHLESNGFEIEAEITAKLAKANARIFEVPISYRPRTYEKGKKIRFRDFIQAVIALIRLRLASN